jgi:hypothetical protein
MTTGPATPARPFRILDAASLIAAAALMLTAERVVYWLWATLSGWFLDVPSWNPRELRLMAWSLALAELDLALLAVLLVRRTGRARLRNGSPGLLVHAAVAIVVGVRLTGWSARALICRGLEGRPGIYSPRWTVEILDYLRDDLRREAVVAILAGWLALALTGRWRAERAWDDRLGRLVAAAWVAFYLAAPLLGMWM